MLNRVPFIRLDKVDLIKSFYAFMKRQFLSIVFNLSREYFSILIKKKSF